MSDFSGELDPLVQKWFLEADQAQIRRALDMIRNVGIEAARVMEREAKKANAREEALFKAHLRQHERLQKEHLARLAAERDQSERRDVARLERMGARQKAAIEQEERRDKARLERLAARQSAAAKKELADAKATAAQDLQISKQADRIAALDHDHELKARRERQRKADWIETHDLEQQMIRRTQMAHQEQVRITNAMRSANRQQEIITEAHQARITARHKAMWSVVRTVTETGSRFMSSITQSALRSMGNAVGYGFQRIVGETRQGTSRQEAILRDSMNDQTRIVTAAMVRQEGAIAAFQRSVDTGAVGSLNRLRYAALGLGGYVSARAIFGPPMEYQQTQIAFEGILGSMERADDMLAQLRNFAKVTPFDFQGVADGARRLLAVGFAAGDVVPILTDIGNVAANLGAGTAEINGVIRALGQMQGKGKASAEELQQISEQLPGFSAINAIAESLGITTAEAFDQMRAGAIPADVAIQAILQGMRDMPGAAGAMDRQSRTLSGRLSTLSDTLRDLTIDAVMPFIDQISNAVGVFTGFIESLFRGSGVWAVVRSGLLGISIALGAILAAKGAVAVMQLMGVALKVIAANPLTALAVALTTIGTILYRHNDDFRGFVQGFLRPIAEWAPAALETASSALAGLADIMDDLFAAIAAGDWAGAASSITSIGSSLIEILGNAVSTALSRLSEIARPMAMALAELVGNAFYILQGFLNSGDLGRIARAIGGMLTDALDMVVANLSAFGWGNIGKILLTGIAGALAYAIGGLPLLAVTAIVAMSPRIQDGIGQVLGDIGTFLAERLPALFVGALYQAARFLSGPVLATVLGPVGVRIIAGLAATIAAGAGAIALGLIDGLKSSLPSIIDAVQGLANDLLTALSSALGDIPVLGVLLEGAFKPVEIILRGIIPTLGVFVDLLTMIPTPILAAAAAVWGLTKAWTAFSVSTRATSAIAAISGAMDTLALRVMYAGDAVTNLGTRMTNATAPAIMNGAASRVQIAMGSIGMAAQGAGAAISAVGAALPAIGLATAIGLPVILGAWQQQQQAAKRHREEINRNAVAMLELQSTAKDVLTEMIQGSESAARALADAGLTIEALFNSINTSAERTGETYANLMGASDIFNELGADMEEFGEAVLKGDRATRDYFATLKGDQSTTEQMNQITDLSYLYAELPDALRDAADQMAETAEATLTQAAATGELNAEEERRLATILAMENPEAALVELAGQVTGRLDRQREATEKANEAYRNFRERVRETIGSLSLFRDEVDRINGNSIDLTRSALALQESFANAMETATDGSANFREAQQTIIELIDQSITRVDDLVNAGRGSEAADAYGALREQVQGIADAFGFGATEAAELRALIEENFPDVDFQVLIDDREALERVDRLRRRAENLRARAEQDIRFSAVADDFDREADRIEERLLGFTGQKWDIYLDFHARLEGEFADWLRQQSNAAEILGNLRSIPQSMGGFWDKPTNVLVGEAGPELIIPLSNPQRAAELLARHAPQFAQPSTPAGASIPTPAVPATALPVNTEGITAWMESVAQALAPMGDLIAESTTPAFRRWEDGLNEMLDRMLGALEAWGVSAVDIGTRTTTALVSAITSTLREGRREVARITRGYARAVVGALNPLLEGVGEAPITLAFAKGGIAEAWHGPQVHVFNEGRRGRGSSHGEAYIPFDPSNRHRSRDLASETVRRLGGNVQWFADGGITAQQVLPGEHVPGVGGDVVGLVREFARRLSAWSLANGGGYVVGSGYRSYADQARLYQRYLAGVPGQAPAAPPGRSMHNFGLASDGNHWRHLNPAAFGLRFPMSYEPWHVEPVEGRGLLTGDYFPMFNPIPTPPDAGERGWFSHVAEKVMKVVYDRVLAAASKFSYQSSMPNLGSSAPTPEVMAAIRQAMRIVGVPDSWLGPLLTLISRESSFNPNAYNGILGASGLMQTIPSTFAAYALPGYGGIFDPLANVIAGLRYILDRYGSIFNVGQAVSPTPTRGYAFGGIVDTEGLYRLAEGNRREMVIPIDKPTRARELLRSLGVDPGSKDERMVRPAGSSAGVQMGNLIGEVVIQSNATDPDAVATIAANKLERAVRHAMAGV